jgi:hypothetical protein
MKKILYEEPNLTSCAVGFKSREKYSKNKEGNKTHNPILIIENIVLNIFIILMI